jgi:hypothetical protein
MAFSFTSKSAKNKRFNYVPRYYDERKERLELKKKAFLEEEKSTDGQRKELLRDAIHQSWNRSKHVSKQKQSANLRIVILIALILVLGYFVFNGLDDVDQVIKSVV